MKTLKRLIMFVSLITITSCGHQTECDRANDLAKTGIDLYCSTDPECCFCKCMNGEGCKIECGITDCVCGDPNQYFYNCEEDRLEIKRCLDYEKLCIDNWKVFADQYCGW